MMHLRLIAPIVGFLFLGFSIAVGQNDPSTMDYMPDRSVVTGHDGGYTYLEVKDDPLNARHYRLDNGLRVILSVNKTEPRIQTMIATRAGSKNDPADNTGLAHYLEHMLFKGTDEYGTLNWEKEQKELDVISGLYDKYNATTDDAKRAAIYRQIDSVSSVAAQYAIANEYDRMVGSIGATGTNAFTSHEVTAYINDIPSNQLETWLTIEAERFKDPVFRMFHTELEAVYEEKNISLDNDGSEAYYTMLRDLFPNHPYGTQTTIGTIEHLKNPSLRKIRKYFDTYYVPNNMVVILVGDLDPSKAIAAVDRHFSWMRPKPIPEFTYESQPERPGPREFTVTGPEPAEVMMAWRSKGAGSREALVMEMADLLLAYKGAGLLDLNLNKKQLVQSASCSPQVMSDYGYHVFYGTPKEGQSLRQVKDLMLAEIENLKRGAFTEEDMQAVIRNLKVDRMKELQSNAGRTFTLLDLFITQVRPEQVSHKIQEMETVSKEEIVGFANEFYDDDYTIVYKENGERKDIAKVEKPPITPLEVNRTDQSPFVKNILSRTPDEIDPVYIDYEHDIAKRVWRDDVNIWSVANTENDLFELYYVFDMGSDNDRVLPYAIDYLRYIGTDELTSEEVSREFFKLGCTFDVSTSRDRVYVTLNGPDDSFKQGVQLFENLLENAQPDQEALQGIIESELTSRSDAKKNRRAILFSGLTSWALYGKKNPFNDVLSNDDVRNLDADELVAKIRGLTDYRHNVLYYGPRDLDNVSGVLDSYHTVPTRLKEYPPARKFGRQYHDENVIYFVDYDMVQAEVVWLRNAEAYNPDNLPTRSLFNEYFGGGMSGIVFQEIRESKALAYGTFSAYRAPDDPKDPHVIMSYLGTQSDKLNDAIGAMNQLHTSLPKSAQSLETAKNALLNQVQTERTVRSGILFRYLTARKFGQEEDTRKIIYENVESLGLDDLERFHKDRYANKPYAYCIIGSKESIDPDMLAQYGEVRELTLEQVFGY